MGQRSQIYIAFDSGYRDIRGHITESEGMFLIARYFQWNYGSRMVSRAVGLVDWIKEYNYALRSKREILIKVAEVNFDMRSIVNSSDILQMLAGSLDIQHDTFQRIDNNDGKLFIEIQDDGSIKYAFTDSWANRPLTAEQYMEWGGYDTEESCGSNYPANVRFLSENATLMTQEELGEFMSRSYWNVEHLPLF